MRIQSAKFVRLTLQAAIGAALLVLAPAAAQGQAVSSEQTMAGATTQEGNEATTKNEDSGGAGEAKPALVPVFKEYRGVSLGMKADDVRSRLMKSLKSKGDGEDLYLFQGGETAVVYYDADARVTAISVDFPVKSTKAPSAKEVLGEEARSNNDGSIYSMVRYPEAGLWVAYSRTAGDSPLVTLTIQKMR